MPNEPENLPHHFHYDDFGRFWLTGMSGCPHYVAISHGAEIWPIYRNLGHGTRQHRQRLAKAAELGYSYLTCTVNSTNIVEKHILAANGWHCVDSFRPLTYKETDKGFVEVWGRRMEPQTHIAAPHLAR